jgi:membrane protease YdiL (CAAX protease family)
MVLMILGSMALFATHVLDRGAVANLQHPTDATVFFLGVAAMFGALLIGLAISAALFQRKYPADMIGRWRWPLFAAGFGLWTIVQAGATLVDYILAPHGFSVTASHATAGLALFAALGLAVQTFTEEFIFRGYLTQGILLALKRPVPASILSGLIFGALHIPNGLPQAVSAALFGIVCSFVAIRTGGIALTAGVHLANNYFGAVGVVRTDDVFKGSAGILTQNTPHLMWWDTGVSALPLVALALVVARLWPSASASDR